MFILFYFGLSLASWTELSPRGLPWIHLKIWKKKKHFFTPIIKEVHKKNIKIISKNIRKSLNIFFYQLHAVFRTQQGRQREPNVKIFILDNILERYFLSILILINFQSTDITLFFENLPIFCRTLPPNTIRPTIERCLADSFSQESNLDLFIQELNLIRESLESDIHDANRTLLSQIVENYFAVIGDEHVVRSFCV